jgi:hypothetical protein
LILSFFFFCFGYFGRSGINLFLHHEIYDSFT